jgi:hypothetical protein
MVENLGIQVPAGRLVATALMEEEEMAGTVGKEKEVAAGELEDILVMEEMVDPQMQMEAQAQVEEVEEDREW